MSDYAELLERAQASQIEFVYIRKTKSYGVKRLNTDPEYVLYTDGRFRKTSNEEILRQFKRIEQ